VSVLVAKRGGRISLGRSRANTRLSASLFVLILGCFCTPGLCARLESSPAQPEVIAYVFKRNDLIQPGEIAAEKLTRINYAFALIQGGQMVNGYGHDDQNLAALIGLKRANPSLSVLISVGGWLGSGNFSLIWR